MKQKLTEKLFKDYPEIFKQKDLNLTQTCMCWGIETGNGWYNLIDNLCAMIMEYCKLNNYPIPEASQVKEKYGTLRFYMDNSNNDIENLINIATHTSAITCEICGKIGELNNGPWYLVKCDSCRK